ncbi:MAG: hypothetical protein CMF50_08895 [Legionellales bacterium]|nr:hypothetical protein [Legionellales bacterium]|tara:strand:- start:14922 stop:15365 length:444 start_codon:yes stop_codon:yes gene_type:complete
MLKKTYFLTVVGLCSLIGFGSASANVSERKGVICLNELELNVRNTQTHTVGSISESHPIGGSGGMFKNIPANTQTKAFLAFDRDSKVAQQYRFGFADKGEGDEHDANPNYVLEVTQTPLDDGKCDIKAEAKKAGSTLLQANVIDWTI